MAPPPLYMPPHLNREIILESLNLREREIIIDLNW